MAVCRSEIVDLSITCWYHCISQCVRGASLLQPERKAWIQQRLAELTGVFAVDVAGFSVRENQLQVLVHLDPRRPWTWSKAEVLRRWTQLHPPRNACRQVLQGKEFDRWIQEKQSNPGFVQTLRRRLVNLGWFMKSLKEPLSRWANEADGEEGAFWSARYKSIAVLDEAALLATCLSIDLPSLAPGQVLPPEEAPFTSLALRLERVRQQGRQDDLRLARNGAAPSANACRGMETGLWLCPIENSVDEDRTRPGLLEGFSLGDYLLIFDETRLLARPGSARANPAADALFERLGISRGAWKSAIARLIARPKRVGVAFAFHRDKLRDAAQKRGRRHLANLNGCPTLSGAK